MTSLPDAALPVIDLSELNDPANHEAFHLKLRHMARDIGFFYLVGHGIDPNERDAMLSSAKEFFALPQDVKDKYDMANSRHFRGYTKSGGEYTRNKPDFREQLDIGEEAQPIADIPDDRLWLNLIGPNQWPTEVPQLEKRVHDYQAKIRAVALKLLRAFLVALEQPEDVLDSLFVGTPQHLLKLVHYPPNLGDDGASKEQVQGCGPHKDGGLLTLLWQDDIGGLQVETDNGWIDIPYIENSYVVNIGEVLELVTDGFLVSNVHQVLRPISQRSRYSMPYFLETSVDTQGLPLLQLPPHLKELSQRKSSDPLNPLFADLGKNLIKSRLRSHRNVTERFYPEQFKIITTKGNIS